MNEKIINNSDKWIEYMSQEDLVQILSYFNTLNDLGLFNNQI